MSDGFSADPTPYAVICHGNFPQYGCGKVYLSSGEYDRQMSYPHRTWRCPLCGAEADWDDDNYERFMYDG